MRRKSIINKCKLFIVVGVCFGVFFSLGYYIGKGTSQKKNTVAVSRNVKKNKLTKANVNTNNEVETPLKEKKFNLREQKNCNYKDVQIGIPVLAYHHVNDSKGTLKGDSLIVPVSAFRAQMKYLKDNNFNVITLDELYEFLQQGIPVPEKSIVITFDDGYKDNYTNAYSILKEHGLKATIFVISNFIGKSDYLTLDDIKAMPPEVIDIESHTANHEKLGQLNYEKQLSTLKESKLRLEDILKRQVKYIAYPYGDHNMDTLKATQAAGYSMAFTIKVGWSDKNDGIYTLDRVYVNGARDMNIFTKIVNDPKYQRHNKSKA